MNPEAAILARLEAIEQQNQQVLALLSRMAVTPVMMREASDKNPPISPSELARLRSKHGKGVLIDLAARMKE